MHVMSQVHVSHHFFWSLARELVLCRALLDATSMMEDPDAADVEEESATFLRPPPGPGIGKISQKSS